VASVSALEERIENLASRFLDPQIPNEPSPGFNPDLDAIAAFRLLAHAEFEDWLESLAKEELDQLTKDVASGLAIRKSHRLLVLAQSFQRPCSLELPFDPGRFKSEALSVLAAATSFLSDNNGIKAGSFCKIAQICGAAVDEIDPALVTSLDGYGKSRGAVAHTSATRVRTLQAPSAEKAAAVTLVQLIKRFVYDLNQL
jgi:hypothetical protein